MRPLSDPPPLLVGAVGLAIGATIALRLLIPNEMDPSAFLAVGERSSQVGYATNLLGDLRTRTGLGHDGRFFFIQANDPWYLDPRDHAAFLDRPIYRAQRMLYPMIAGGFGSFGPEVIVWAMLTTNVVALAVGTFVAAKLAVAWGISAWFGLWVPLNVGLLFELDIGGAGIIAYVWCLGAIYVLANGSIWSASALFAAAALSREVMVAFAAGIVVLWWLEHRRVLWRLVAVPLAAVGVWNAYLQMRLAGIRGMGPSEDALAPPFVGVVQATGSWVREPLHLFVDLVLVVVVIASVPLALRRRLSIGWGALPFVALGLVLSADVWREPFNSSRALAPVFTAVPFLIAARDRAVTVTSPLHGDAGEEGRLDPSSPPA